MLNVFIIVKILNYNYNFSLKIVSYSIVNGFLVGYGSNDFTIIDSVLK